MSDEDIALAIRDVLEELKNISLSLAVIARAHQSNYYVPDSKEEK